MHVFARHSLEPTCFVCCWVFLCIRLHSSPWPSLICTNTCPMKDQHRVVTRYRCRCRAFGQKQAWGHLPRLPVRVHHIISFWDLMSGQRDWNSRLWRGVGGICFRIPNERYWSSIFLLTFVISDGSFCSSFKLWCRAESSVYVLHAPHAATLDGLFNLLAEGRAVAALKCVFPALHPLAGATRARVAGTAALHPRHHACGLTDGVAALDLVEVSHWLPVTLGL